jgi:hypothetical protein
LTLSARGERAMLLHIRYCKISIMLFVYCCHCVTERVREEGEEGEREQRPTDRQRETETETKT